MIRKQTGQSVGCAFTLIEALVVIAIIAILISILLPAGRQARQRCPDRPVPANPKGMGVGLFYYNQFGFVRTSSHSPTPTATRTTRLSSKSPPTSWTSPPCREILGDPNSFWIVSDPGSAPPTRNSTTAPGYRPFCSVRHQLR